MTVPTNAALQSSRLVAQMARDAPMRVSHPAQLHHAHAEQRSHPSNSLFESRVELTLNSAVGASPPATNMLGSPCSRQAVIGQNPKRPSAAMIR